MQRHAYSMGFDPMLFGSRMRDCLQQLLKNAVRDYEPYLIEEFDELDEDSWSDAVSASLTPNGEATIKLSTIVDSDDCAVKTLKRVAKVTAAKLKRDLKKDFADSTRPDGFTDDELEFVFEVMTEDSSAKSRSAEELRRLTGASRMNPFAAAASKVVSDECVRLKAEMETKVQELEKQIEAVKAEYASKI